VACCGNDPRKLVADAVRAGQSSSEQGPAAQIVTTKIRA